MGLGGRLRRKETGSSSLYGQSVVHMEAIAVEEALQQAKTRPWEEVEILIDSAELLNQSKNLSSGHRHVALLLTSIRDLCSNFLRVAIRKFSPLLLLCIPVVPLPQTKKFTVLVPPFWFSSTHPIEPRLDESKLVEPHHLFE